MLKLVRVYSLVAVVCTAALMADDSFRVRKVGGWPYGSSFCVGYDARHDVAFVCNGQVLMSLDVSNPAHPVKIGEVQLSGEANRLSLSGDYVYIAAGKLDIVDISDPRSPALKSSLNTPGNAFSVFASGNYAYVSDEAAGLRIIDVSVPSRPLEVGAYQTAGRAIYAVASGNRVYLSDYGAGLHILDVSNPSHPQQLGFFPESEAWGVAVSGHHAIIQKFDGSDIRIVDVADPSFPTEVSFIDWPTPGNGVSMLARGTYVYVCAEWMDGVGVQIVNISDPAHPIAVGGIRNIAAATLAVSEELAYISDWANGFHVYDISTPSKPILLSNFDVPGLLNDVTVVGGMAYIATAGVVHPEPRSAAYLHVELRLIDVSTPSSALEKGFSQGGIATGMGVAASGRYAYIASDRNGLRVFDVSTPGTPTETGFVLSPGRSVRVMLSGSHAFIAAGDSGLRIVDVSDPSAPVERGHYDSPGFTSDLAVSGGYAYLADGSAGIRIVDIARLSSPREVGHYITKQPAVSVAISRNDLLAGGPNGDLYRIDVANASAPSLKSTLSLPGGGNIRRIAISDNYAYLAAGLDGVRIVNISTAGSMTGSAFYIPRADINGLALSGKYIYAIGADAGLYILEFQSDSASRRRAVRH